MIAEQHTCGKCDDIIPDYVEIGVQSFFPAQALNDLVKIQKEYGDRLTIVGGYDSQGEAGSPSASEDVIKNEAHRIVDSYGELGNYVCMPMIMDTVGNWAIYEGSPRQKLFRDEFYSYSKKK